MHTHHPRKRFGQHFLVNPAIIARIVQVIAPQESDHLVEIGPGLGALTQAVLPLSKKLTVVELDRDVIPLLRKACVGLGELIIHEADALKFDFNRCVTANDKLKIIGNLPYNISTPLIFHLLEYKTVINDMVFMLQKEVVDRLTAQVGSADYNRLSIMVQYHCQTELLFIVPPSAFNPPPKVDSAIVRLTPYATPPYVANDYQRFKTIVHTAFLHRRKTLKNNLKELFSSEQLLALNIDPSKRPQDLTIEDYVRLANAS